MAGYELEADKYPVPAGAFLQCIYREIWKRLAPAADPSCVLAANRPLTASFRSGAMVARSGVMQMHYNLNLRRTYARECSRTNSY